MPRITEDERKRFHNYLDESIDKLNSLKNSKKVHWSKLTVQTLQKMVAIESAELDLAVSCWRFPKDIESENFDLINLNMMIIDNGRISE